MKVIRKRQIKSLPFLKQESGKSVFIKILSSIRRVTMQGDPASVIKVINLENGELSQYLVYKSLENMLLEAFPCLMDDDSIAIGKCLEIVKGEKVQSQNDKKKQYYPFDIYELDDEQFE